MRDLIHRFKYKGEFYLRCQLAQWLLEGFSDERIGKTDMVIPVPLHSARLREREYNQSEELAKLLCKHTGLPLHAPLRRTRPTTTQTHLQRKERMETLRNAFEIRKNGQVRGLHLLLIDDVFTTGSTVAECTRILNLAGAASVRVLTIARG